MIVAGDEERASTSLWGEHPRPRRSLERHLRASTHRLAVWILLVSGCAVSGCAAAPHAVIKSDSLPEYHQVVVCELRRGVFGPSIAVHYALVDGDPDPVGTALVRAHDVVSENGGGSSELHERCWQGGLKDAFLHRRDQKFVRKPRLLR